jgi:hypothetical protein
MLWQCGITGSRDFTRVTDFRIILIPDTPFAIVPVTGSFILNNKGANNETIADYAAGVCSVCIARIR